MKEETKQNYNLVLAIDGHFPFMSHVRSEKDLVAEYKDAVLGEKRFLTWESGCIEMKYVLGAFQ